MGSRVHPGFMSQQGTQTSKQLLVQWCKHYDRGTRGPDLGIRISFPKCLLFSVFTELRATGNGGGSAPSEYPRVAGSSFLWAPS